MSRMSIDYWIKQTREKPLFPELEWSKPENKMYAGKLLIIGGNLHGFSAPATAFNTADSAGIGVSRVILPNAIKKSVKAFMPEADFAITTPSGSFAAASLDMFMENAAWSDGVLLAGDLGRNSETAILLEKFVAKYQEPLTLTKDALDYFLETPNQITHRERTLLVGSFAQIQKILSNAKFKTPITYRMDLLHLVEALHDFTAVHQASIITKHGSKFIVASNGQVSTTVIDPNVEIWRVSAAAKATVWWIQHPTKIFEALTSSLRTL